MGTLFIVIIVVIILISFFYKNDDNYEKEEKQKAVIARLRQRYVEALKGSNKATAAKFGRDYYTYLRNSRSLSPADEQTIAREVAGMNVNQ